MNSEWQTYLAQHTGSGEKIPTPFLNTAAREFELTTGTGILIDLSQLGLLKISGEENKKFLQGQLTCDTEAIDSEHSVLGTYCNIKGRAYASFRAFQRGEDIYLALDKDLVEPLMKVLSKYIVFSKAEMSDASSELVLLGLYGESAAKKVSSVAMQSSSNPGEVFTQASTQFICHHNSPEPLYLIVATPNEAINLHQEFGDAVQLVGYNAWDLLLINSGFAEIKAAATELFIPLELNQQYLGFINFEKGCYTGQEIIARLHYRGKSKQHLYIGSATSERLPEINDPIILANQPDAQPAGHVVNVAWKGEKEAAIIAVIKNQFALTENLQLSSANGPKLEVSEVPYAITNEEDD